MANASIRSAAEMPGNCWGNGLSFCGRRCLIGLWSLGLCRTDFFVRGLVMLVMRLRLDGYVSGMSMISNIW